MSASTEIRPFPFAIILFLGLHSLQNQLHCLVVVSLDFEVRYPAVALSGGDLTMPQEILDRRKISVGIEKLRGHSVAKPMTGDRQPALSCIVFDPLLNPSHGERLPFHRSLLDQEQGFRFRGSFLEVRQKSETGIVTHIDDPILRPFPMEDKDLSSPVLYCIYSQLSHLLNPKATAEHQHEHSPVSWISDDGKEPRDLVVLQVPGQRLGQTERDPGDGIDHISLLLIDEIVEEEAYRLKVARDRLRPPPLSEEMIDIHSDLLTGHLRERHGKPSDELIKDVDVTLDRVG